MKMTFSKVMQLVLMFYGLARKYADSVTGGSASRGCLIYEKNSTLFIKTGESADKTLDGGLSDGTLSLSLTLIDG